MKKILLLLVLIITVSATAQKINWMTMNEAIEAQTKAPKKIFVDVYTNWCGPCKMLDKNTFSNADVAAYINKNFYAVKFNGEGNEAITMGDKDFKNPNFDPAKTRTRNSMHQFARFMGVRAYPTLLFIDSDGKLINKVASYLTPSQLEVYLKMYASGDYKAINSQEKFNEYYKNFKLTFQTK
jgi:thioredoxin-related protein